MKIIFSIIIFTYCVSFAQNEAYLVQKNGYNSEAFITQNNGNNLLQGPSLLTGDNIVESKNSYFHNAAFQKTVFGNNHLSVSQENAVLQNKIELFQSATSDNIGEFSQVNGSHLLNLYEISENGYNESHIKQENGNSNISILRYAGNNNIIPSDENKRLNNINNPFGVYQNGNNNNVVGSFPTGNPNQPAMINNNTPAIQSSLLGSNWLEIYQNGNENNIGIKQISSINNEALLKQVGDNNSIAVIQNSVLGSNFLYVEQNGNKALSVYQNSFFGNNSIIVIQH